MSKTVLFCAVGIALVALLCVLLCAGCTQRGGGDGPGSTETPEPTESVTLRFHSFDGGGPVYAGSVDDPFVASVEIERRYNDPKHEEMDGSPYEVIFTVTGRKPGSTTLTVSASSPIMESETYRYAVTVDEDLRVRVGKAQEILPEDAIRPVPTLVIGTETKLFYATLADNEAAKALTEKLAAQPLTLTMRNDGGVDKAVDLPWTLPSADEPVTTSPGDILLFEGDRLCLFFGENTYNFTPIARIGNTSREELLGALGEGDAQVDLYIEWSE